MEGGRQVGEYRKPGIFPEVATWLYRQIADVWKLDNEFAARWASWAFAKEHRDLKVVLAAFMLVQSRCGEPVIEGPDPVPRRGFPRRGRGDVPHPRQGRHQPENVAPAWRHPRPAGDRGDQPELGFGKSARAPAKGRYVKVVEKYLRYREDNPKMLEGLVAAGFRTSVMELARRVGYKPTTPKFFEILRWRQKQAEDGRRETWAADRFTAENAVAWFSGPLPDDRRFDELPRGRRIPCVEPETMPGLCTPSVLQGIEGAIGCSFLSERDDWVGFPLWVATVRLMQRLRYRDGITYSVQHALQHLSGSRSHAAIWAACLTKHAEAVQDGLFEVFEDLARNGPSSAELQQGHDMWIQRAGAGDSILDDLDSTATNELFGAPIQSLQQYLDEFDGRSSDRWAASVRAAMDTAIVVLPPGCEPHGGLVPYRLWSDSIATGRKYRSIAQRYPWSKKLPELVVGKKGVSVVNPNGQAVTVSRSGVRGTVRQ